MACIAGDPVALAALDAQMVRPTASDVARAHRVEDEELAQVVRERVLVHAAGEEPRLASYEGRGPLAGWLRVVAVRAAITIVRRRKPAERAGNEDDDDALADIVTDDIELAHVRAEYALAFKACFQQALAALDPRDRTVLRFSVLDGLSIDDIGRLHGVHRATAARWLVKIREDLHKGTRERLSATLRLEGRDFESLVGDLLSRMDISLRRVLDELGGAVITPSGEDERA